MWNANGARDARTVPERSAHHRITSTGIPNTSGIERLDADLFHYAGPQHWRESAEYELRRALDLATPIRVSGGDVQHTLSIESHRRHALNHRPYSRAPGELDFFGAQRRFSDDVRKHSRNNAVDPNHHDSLTRGLRFAI